MNYDFWQLDNMGKRAVLHGAWCFRSPVAPSRLHGFTMIELLVAVAIAAILAMIGLPSLKGTLNDLQQKSALSLIVSDLNQARNEAITRASRTLVCARNAAGTSCATTTPSWQSGWVVCTDVTTAGTTPELPPSDGVCDLSTATNPNPILVRPAVTAPLTLALKDSTATDIYTMRFNPNSTQGAVGSAPITFTLGGTWTGVVNRTISVAGTGNISK